MKIESKKINNINVVSLNERTIDFANGVDFKEFIYELLSEGNGKIIVNLENVAYIDSAGLGSIIAAAGHAKQSDRIVIYCSLSEDVSKLFKMNNLGKYLSVFENVEEAIKSLK